MSDRLLKSNKQADPNTFVIITFMNSMDRTQFFNPTYFIKMHGAGNSFIIVQPSQLTQQQLSDLAVKLCREEVGIGANTLLVVIPPNRQNMENRPKYAMKVYNRDGSYAEMCGNGLRCFAACLSQMGAVEGNEFEVGTDAGSKKCVVYKQNSKYRVKIQMGLLEGGSEAQDCLKIVSSVFRDEKIQLAQLIDFCVPHLVIYFQQLPTVEKIISSSKQLQKHINANINFAKLLPTQHDQPSLQLKTFQRGCGLTLACGSGAAATYVIGIRNKLIQRRGLVVHVDGGELKLSVQDGVVVKDGPVEFICRGIYY